MQPVYLTFRMCFRDLYLLASVRVRYPLFAHFSQTGPIMDKLCGEITKLDIWLAVYDSCVYSAMASIIRDTSGNMTN